ATGEAGTSSLRKRFRENGAFFALIIRKVGASETLQLNKKRGGTVIKSKEADGKVQRILFSDY
ncbi:hypothetical protein R0K17_30910, partial [Planococcus sp. SIMBA_143]